ncbi:N-acetylmuramoyl-L-alanine amidase [Parvularcula bermudensis HTCC2503]|uniref:N-acetylmuramoyl-L-alanine amidase n=1 Tax=Parvularcula bermudensis (strain ATCC BAA-594 / HTCC2503 / KCTC 12087) TaxID=314260 RepID=E0TDU6_PARBH|nr:N-acetylmuramoyl-L-alanine amidase [Parvularcula bermudensis]ADM10012.1 N-acetylmuramoyl-L-alanine amidase [Parvularcula bermudensis HTCC2503]
MKRALVFWSVAVLSFCGILAIASEQPTAPSIDQVRIGHHQAGHTRLVLDLDAKPAYAVAPLEDHRIALVIERADWSGADDLPKGVGLIETIKLEDNRRLLIHLSSAALPERNFILPPEGEIDHWRLVIDFDDVPSAVYAQAVKDAVGRLAEMTPPVATVTGTPAPAPIKGEAAPAMTAMTGMTRVPGLKPQRPEAQRVAAGDEDGRLTIVIDPGHGGRDPGAIGPSGLLEKTVTFDTAKRLQTVLSARGYHAVLTRDEDSYVELDDRITLARARQANMFISIHADSNPNDTVRGASVYTLSESRSRRMAEDAVSAGDFRVFDRDLKNEASEVSSILIDLANTDTKNRSARLATTIIDAMAGEVRMVNNTHRKAGLAVLLSPDVPAVLVELAFMSNASDEANLKSPRWRAKIASTIADGVDTYFADIASQHADASRTALN